MGNILVIAILAVVVGLIVRGMILDRKNGTSCGGCAGGSGCSSGCGEHGACSDPGRRDPAQPLKEFHLR